MKKTVIILSIFAFMACKHTKQYSYDNEQFERESIERDLIMQEIENFDKQVFIDDNGDFFFISDKSKDREGIGVNSTIEELAEKYSDLRVLYIRDKDRFIAESFQAVCKFVLNEDDFIGKVDSNEKVVVLKLSDFKPNSRITKMWLK